MRAVGTAATAYRISTQFIVKNSRLPDFPEDVTVMEADRH
jgi:hypothetical protein